MEENVTQESNQLQQATQPAIKADEVKIRTALAEGGVLESDFTDNAPQDEQQKQDEGFDAQVEPKQQEAATQVSDELPKIEPKTSSFDPVWKNIQQIYESEYGENTFKKPEGITPDTEFQVLLDFLHKNLEPNLEGIPTEAKEIIELNKQGVYDPAEYFKQKSTQTDVENLSPYDFLFNMYRAQQGKSDKNPNGHTDEEIHDYLKGMNKIQLKELADQKKGSVLAQREQTRVQREQEQLRLMETQFQSIQSQKEEQAKKVVNQFGSSGDFFGVEPSIEERESYNRDFVEMVKLNPKTGTSKLYDMLQDDAMLYKIGYYIWKGEDLKGYLTEMKENVKKNIESRLDPTLAKEKGSTKLSRPVDRGKLY